MSEIEKKDLSISYLSKECTSILEQRNRSYGGLKLGLLWQNEAFLYNFSEQHVEGTNVTTGPKCNKGPKCNNTWS